MLQKLLHTITRPFNALLIVVIASTLFSSPLFASESTDSEISEKHIDSLLIVLKNCDKEDTLKLNTLMNLSSAYESVDRSKSFEYIKASLALAKKLDFKKRIGICYNYFGDLYWFSGDYTNASNSYFEALKIFEELNDPYRISECYRNIGWIYQGQNNWPLTLKYYNAALEINLKNDFKRKLISSYDDLGILYKLMGKYPEAIEYCHKAIDVAKELKADRGIAAGYGNLGSTYFQMKEYALAIENYSIAHKIHLQINDNYNTVEDFNGLSECYLQLGQPGRAVEYSLQGLALAKKHGYKNSVSNAYNKLAQAYERQKNYQQAFEYLQLYTDLKDSTYNEQNSRQINEMSAKYESEKKELIISSFEEKSAQDKKFKIYLVIFCSLIAVFTIFLFRSFLQKKKANNSLSLAYKEIEVKNKDITDSINYAKQIQRARLPNPAIILNRLPDAFGLYKPKDVVSGDFYWFAEHENGKILLAAADCTGHGIPGAFMSLIGIDELNHAALEKRLDDVSSILSSVNKGVKKALRQNEQNSMSRDGMDIALCIFDLANSILEYAGANRPLYYIRENQLFEVAPTKAAIGGTTSNEQEFKSHSIDIKKGDMIYVFTDGFADQFGGDSGKKFMTKRFKDLLLSIHHLSAVEQEAALEKALNEWKKDISQVDDILVMGIRI
ncbi:MAG: tetratricopeptide repeat protein [Bacteroidetes bacterium]|nr:tetratricopeptide repeat protein [Bacteroidota bacterium]